MQTAKFTPYGIPGKTWTMEPNTNPRMIRYVAWGYRCMAVSKTLVVRITPSKSPTPSGRRKGRYSVLMDRMISSYIPMTKNR